MIVPPPGVHCSECHIAFGARELVKRENDQYFHENVSRRCWTRWNLRRLKQRAAKTRMPARA
jgi:hypothetical protein